MEIIFTGRHIEVTDAIKEYATSKVSKLPRYYDRVKTIEVVTDKRDNHHYEVEVIVDADHADRFVGKYSADDLYACIDKAVDKLERQLTDHKEKLRNHKHSK